MKHININIDELDFSKPISHYSDIFGLSDNAMRNRFKKLGIYNKFIYTQGHISKIKSKVLQDDYNKNPKKCIHCNQIIDFKRKKNNYCSIRCSSTYTQKEGGHCKWNEEDKVKIKEKLYIYSKS